MKPLKWMQEVENKSTAVNVKNLAEFKDGHRILYEGNVFENTWEGESDQPGR